MVTFQIVERNTVGILLPNNETGEFSNDDDSVFFDDSNDSFDIDMDKLNMLIFQLLKANLNIHEYIHIKDEISEGRLTNYEIVNTI
ncbi:hypothetical protein C1645_838475 [Glomus cerebriforme]|uniref:Uncharacterized protein n=1 Tax=Glomus cerebriforme TaxID=658196 RepID=A0A397S774_9GLOM|nr:hypothetical protein C1645_838475 [Glomus cerebriforme]